MTYIHSFPAVNLPAQFGTPVIANTVHYVACIGSCVTYLYDNSYQLVNENRSGAVVFNATYTYDGLGNRLSKVENGQTTTSTYNAANELLLSVAPTGVLTTSSYDANGNLALENAGGALTTYTWDSENHLLSVSANTGAETYTYSTNGLRRKKQTATSTTYFAWDGQNVLATQE